MNEEKFIICFDDGLKNNLLSKGYKKIYERNKYCVFENICKSTFNFDNIDKTKYLYSDNFKMFF